MDRWMRQEYWDRASSEARKLQQPRICPLVDGGGLTEVMQDAIREGLGLSLARRLYWLRVCDYPEDTRLVAGKGYDPLEVWFCWEQRHDGEWQPGIAGLLAYDADTQAWRVHT